MSVPPPGQPPRGVDRWQGSPWAIPAGTTFVIERVGWDLREDATWRQRYNQDRAAGLPVGFYYGSPGLNVAAQAEFYAGLVDGIDHELGDWLDHAVGDVPDDVISTDYVDEFRGVFDVGIYVNGAALDRLGPYQRFERIWFAGTSSPARWLLRQTTGLTQGDDLDVAADRTAAAYVAPHWSGFAWPGR